MGSGGKGLFTFATGINGVDIPKSNHELSHHAEQHESEFYVTHPLNLFAIGNYAYKSIQDPHLSSLDIKTRATPTTTRRQRIIHNLKLATY
jgi:hypothetical protein